MTSRRNDQTIGKLSSRRSVQYVKCQVTNKPCTLKQHAPGSVVLILQKSVTMYVQMCTIYKVADTLNLNSKHWQLVTMSARIKPWHGTLPLLVWCNAH